MDILKDEAIVLRKSFSGDYDLSLTVYMKKYGKENIYLPKGQILKSPFLPSSEPFTWFKGLFIKRREKFFIKEIDRSRSLGLLISKDYKKFETAFFIADLFNRYIIFPDEKVFILLKKSLYYLTQEIDPHIFSLNFTAKLIYLSGIFPELEMCVRCGVNVDKKNYGFLSQIDGGVVCKKCSRRKSDLFYTDIQDLKKLKVVSFKNLKKLKIKNTQKLQNFLIDYIGKNL
ncbi:DNA repair protein RecO [Persephonella sp.]